METYNLTTQQKNIYNLQKYYPDTAISNQCGAIIYNEEMGAETLADAIRTVIMWQSGLRLQLRPDGRQYVAEYDGRDVEIPVLSFADRAELDEYAQKLAKSPMQIEDSPLYRFVIFSIRERTGVLACLNHLISDAWTFGVLAKQVSDAYYVADRQDRVAVSDECSQVTYDYTEYIAEEAYRSSTRFENDRAYWQNLYKNGIEDSSIRLHTSGQKKVRSKRKVFAFRKTDAVTFETAILLYLSRLHPENNTVTIGSIALNRNGIKQKHMAGMFVSTVIWTVTVSADMTVAELKNEVESAHRRMFRHQRYPYTDILKFLREEKKLHGSPYDVIVSFQNATIDNNTETIWYANGYSEVPLTFHIDYRDDAEEYRLTVDYQTDVFSDEKEVDFIVDRINKILRQIEAVPKKKLEEIDILCEKERLLLLSDFNDTKVDYPKDKCVHELFMEQAARTPDKTALVFHGEEFSYRRLDEMSNALANLLRTKGIGCGDIVPIISRRSWHIIVAMLGILKVGGAYMPVDPDYPNERISYMLKLADAGVVLTYQYDNSDVISMSDDNLSYIDLGTVDFQSGTKPVENVNRSDDVCYVIFTSGSTGEPKGICVSHKNVGNYVDNNNNNVCHTIIKNEYKSIISVTNVVFDIFVTESLLPLINGICIYFTDDEQAMSQSTVAGLVAQNDIDVLQTTPTKMRSFLMDRDNIDYLHHLKAIVLGGEAFPPELFAFLRSKTNADVFNIYGPAETTVWSTNARVDNAESITIGRPIANTQVYILDGKQKLLPIGAAGELCIAGDGVGKGYLNQPELTVERFVDNPFASEENGHGKVLYRTGDLARWRADGELEYLGRIDTQVKIRGLRIELGEIESVMSEVDGIALTAAAAQRDEKGRQYLVGYYTVDNGVISDVSKDTDNLTADISAKVGFAAKAISDIESKLHAHLTTKLSRYMIPNFFVHLDAMPMTASGKTDRKNLPLPDFSSEKSDFIVPVTETEKKLAKLWSEQLGIKRISRTDDFFALGGDSLAAIALVTEIEKEFSVMISVKEFFSHPLLSEQASYIENVQSKETGNVVEHISTTGTKKYALLPQQKAIYAACKKAPDSRIYNVSARLSLPDSIDRNRLATSIKKVVFSHKVLNCRIVDEKDDIYAEYYPKCCFEIEPLDKNELETDFFRPFELLKAPLIRVGISGDELLFDTHHIVCDGGSLNVILREVAGVYQGQKIQQETMWYGDYANYMSGKVFDEHISFFKNRLKCDFEPVMLPESDTGLTGGKSYFYALPGKLTEQIGGYERMHSLTDTMFYFGAYVILLSKYSGKADVLTGIILQNRLIPETRDMIGMFVNTLPVYVKADGSVDTFLSDVKDYITGLYQYQDVPYLTVSDSLDIGGEAVNTVFVFQDSARHFAFDDMELLPQFIETDTNKFDLLFEITPDNGSVSLRLEYDMSKYEVTLIERMAKAYEMILEQLVAMDSSVSVESIDVLTCDERKRLLETFNDTAVPYPKDKCVHELFMEQAARTPDKTTLVFHGEEFSYRRLDEMSNALANLLRAKGVGRGEIVPIISRRSWHIIVAMLGIIKSGGAYMPVDPDYPVERISYMLKLANARVVLTYQYDNSDVISMSDDNLSYIDLGTVDYQSRMEPLENVNRSDDVCYVIFTSGSTGEPKGICISHKNVGNYVDNNNNNVCHTIIKNEYKSIISVTNTVFDIFVTESLLPLINGICIYFTDDQQAMSQSAVSELVTRNDIDVLQTTPTKMRSFLIDRDSVDYLYHLKAIVLGGEAFPVELFAFLKNETDADVFNIYGPAETTVWSTNAKVDNADSITIGQPIANTQVYILDGKQKLLPIGVAGELCIAGDGVGKGYLNQPGLTAEKFISNPFTTKENGHGKVLYRTGDLARWRADGELEYLGRIDTQVKIRGLRIELGEIESVMSEVDGIALTAAAAQRDEKGRQYLVGYYTVDNGVISDVSKDTDNLTADISAKVGFAAKAISDIESKLHAHLTTKLPRYMIPNFFVHLDAMPMTASGKTDRKNLPLPDFSEIGKAYVAPSTKQEKELCGILREVLSADKIGVSDDFFDMGGDSLAAISYVAMAHEKGYDFSLQDVYDYPTVENLIVAMNGSRNTAESYNAESFKKYETLLSVNVTEDRAIFKKQSLGNVLLTGATGFLGAHILDSFLSDEKGKLYCLVRGGSEAEKRLYATLRYYFGHKYDGQIGKRIVVVNGDITQDSLADFLPKDVQTVIHAAATVKHFGPDDYFERINKDGTAHITEYAKRINARLIHISTVSVSGNMLADNMEIDRSGLKLDYSETMLYAGQPLDNVYVKSKFEAERVVLDNMLEGLNAKIIRVGNLTNRASDYKFQSNYSENAFLKRIKAVLEFGEFPDYLMEQYAEFSPVDYTASGIIRIAQFSGDYSVFHLNSNKPLYYQDMLVMLENLGISMRVVEGDTFYKDIEKTIGKREQAYIFEALQNDMDKDGRLLYESSIHIKNDFTVWFLKQTGFEWNEIDEEYVIGYIDYFRKLGYLDV